MENLDMETKCKLKGDNGFACDINIPSTAAYPMLLYVFKKQFLNCLGVMKTIMKY